MTEGLIVRMFGHPFLLSLKSTAWMPTFKADWKQSKTRLWDWDTEKRHLRREMETGRDSWEPFVHPEIKSAQNRENYVVATQHWRNTTERNNALWKPTHRWQCYAISFAFRKKNVHLCYIPQIKIIIVTHHRDFLMKLGLEAGNVFESVDVKPDSSAMWSHRGERRVGKDQSAKL